MTFDELYPEWDYLATAPLPHYSMMMGRDMGFCAICDTPTRWIQMDFECHICSPACEDTQWQEYWAVIRDTAPFSDLSFSGE